ncbi:hypothetical protein [Chthonobacter rhizosphaerae]|nr:hypothetical protein [Chthonobacter rhizosphaerae]
MSIADLPKLPTAVLSLKTLPRGWYFLASLLISGAMWGGIISSVLAII